MLCFLLRYLVAILSAGQVRMKKKNEVGIIGIYFLIALFFLSCIFPFRVGKEESLLKSEDICQVFGD